MVYYPRPMVYLGNSGIFMCFMVYRRSSRIIGWYVIYFPLYTILKSSVQNLGGILPSIWRWVVYHQSMAGCLGRYTVAVFNAVVYHKNRLPWQIIVVYHSIYTHSMVYHQSMAGCLEWYTIEVFNACGKQFGLCLLSHDVKLPVVYDGQFIWYTTRYTHLMVYYSMTWYTTEPRSKQH